MTTHATVGHGREHVFAAAASPGFTLSLAVGDFAALCGDLSTVRGRKRVMVVLSLGEESSSVPNLFGESVRNAQYLLERAGLRVGGSSHAPSEEVGEELVVASDPPAEAVLPRNAPVSLLVSSGAGEETFVMPDLLGREIGGARRQLESLGFHVLTPPAAPSVGTILVQEPAPGSRITRASTILLQASGRIIR